MNDQHRQTITVDAEAQQAWLPELRRALGQATLAVEDAAGEEHTLVAIDAASASWQPYEGDARQFVLRRQGNRITSWPCELGPTHAMHLRVDGRGQLELWSGPQAVAKLFDAEASPEDWLPGLVHCEASTVERLEALLASEHATHLRSLDLGGSSALTDLMPLAGLNALRSLNLSFCESLSDLTPLAGLKGLTSLDLSGFGRLTDLTPLAGLNGLRSLYLSGCKSVSDLMPLAGLNALSSLCLSACKSLSELTGLAGLNGLTSLALHNCVNLTDLKGLAGLDKLTSLDLSHCDSLSNLTGLAGLNGLRSLDLTCCESLSDLTPLAGLNGLRSLNLSCCESLSDLAPLAGLIGLTSLDLLSCSRLSLVAPLSDLRNLAKLDLSLCPNLRDADALNGLEALRDLALDETATRDGILLACALRRGDADLSERTVTAAGSFGLSKSPERHARGLVDAVEGLVRQGHADLAAVARDVVQALRARGEVPAKTWAVLFAALAGAPDPGQRPAFEAALADLPLAETEPVLAPALLALADVQASAKAWALDLARRALAPVAASATHAREVAPAAAVFFHAQDQADELDAWMERGTVVQVPAWRDRVLLALLERALAKGQPLEARRLLGLMQTPERRDEARALLVRHLAGMAMFRDAAAELDAIVDRARQASAAAAALALAPAFAGEPQAGLSLLTALDGDPDTLADVLAAMVAQAPDSDLVRELATVFAPTSGMDLGAEVDALLAHEAVCDSTRPRELKALRGRVRADARLAREVLARGAAALLVAEGLVAGDDAAELAAALVGGAA